MRALAAVKQGTMLTIDVPCLDAKVIEALAGSGGDVNAVSEDGDTPLHCSSYQGEAKACRTLIALGANVNAQSRMDKDTALHRYVWDPYALV